MIREDEVEIRGYRFAHLFVDSLDLPGVGPVVAATAIHDKRSQRSIGGVRLVSGAWPGNHHEVADLAKAMTPKAALAGLVAGGQKTTIFFEDGLPESPAGKAAVMAAHLKGVVAEYDGAVFGPDMNCNEPVMDLLAHRHGLGVHSVGLPRNNGGLSIDSQGYTAYGVLVALQAAAEVRGWRWSERSVSIQGFGAVGGNLALALAQAGAVVKAVSCRYGMLASEGGLEAAVLARVRKGSDEEQVQAFKEYARGESSARFASDPDQLFEVEADVVVPAARTNCLVLAEELQQMADEGRPNAQSVEAFLHKARPSVVLEAANQPLSSGAEAYLESEGVVVLPDYLINCGGLIGCWADHERREELESPSEEKLEEIENDTLTFIGRTVQANVREVLKMKDEGVVQSLREGAAKLSEQRREQIVEGFKEGSG